MDRSRKVARMLIRDKMTMEQAITVIFHKVNELITAVNDLDQQVREIKGDSCPTTLNRK